MIFNKSDIVPYGTTGGLDTVAVRMPVDEIAREVIDAGGGYIAAPSANTSGRPSPTTAQHVAEDLTGRVDMIVDGGAVEIGVESTILDVTVEPPMILRPGAITKEMFSSLLCNVSYQFFYMMSCSLQKTVHDRTSDSRSIKRLTVDIIYLVVIKLS